MKLDKPIALVTCYFHHNYGSMLQAYATQMIFEEWKLPYETIACKAPIHYMQENKFIYYVKKILIADWTLWLGKKRLSYRKKINKEFSANCGQRDVCFEEFAKNNFKVSSLYPNRQSLEVAARKYSAFLVGSDQLWRTDSVEHGYYTLEWVPDDIHKVAYSTSFGITQIPWFQRTKNIKFMKRFDHIAVREKSGADIVKNMIGRDVPVVLDPTLLFTGEQWLHIQDNDPIIKSDYIFCYLLGNNPSQREFIRSFKDKTRLRIVALQHLDDYIKSDINFPDEAPYNIGPREFLNLIRHAKYVFTDSFHCSVFSILYHKDFFTFSRFSDNGKQSTNTRIDNLLKLTGLDNRKKKEEYGVDYCISLKTDYVIVEDKLLKLRNSSLDYLRKAFSDYLD